MMSATVMPLMRWPTVPCTTAAPAAWKRKKASTIVSRPNDDPLASPHSPKMPSRIANAWPVRPVACVARLRSPVRHQITARAMRPPSSGKAGTMLNRNSSALMKPSQPISASAGLVVTPSRASARSLKRWPLATTAPAPTQSPEERERDGRSRDRDLQLLARALGLAPHLRQPAEEPQVDARDRDSQSARRERVPELVQDQRGEVAEGARDRDR